MRIIEKIKDTGFANIKHLERIEEELNNLLIVEYNDKSVDFLERETLYDSFGNVLNYIRKRKEQMKG